MNDNAARQGVVSQIVKVSLEYISGAFRSLKGEQTCKSAAWLRLVLSRLLDGGTAQMLLKLSSNA